MPINVIYDQMRDYDTVHNIYTGIIIGVDALRLWVMHGHTGVHPLKPMMDIENLEIRAYPYFRKIYNSIYISVKFIVPTTSAKFTFFGLVYVFCFSLF